ASAGSWWSACGRWAWWEWWPPGRVARLRWYVSHYVQRSTPTSSRAAADGAGRLRGRRSRADGGEELLPDRSAVEAGESAGAGAPAGAVSAGQEVPDCLRGGLRLCGQRGLLRAAGAAAGRGVFRGAAAGVARGVDRGPAEPGHRDL